MCIYIYIYTHIYLFVINHDQSIARSDVFQFVFDQGTTPFCTPSALASSSSNLLRFQILSATRPTSLTDTGRCQKIVDYHWIIIIVQNIKQRF